MVYVANYGSNTVSVIDGKTNQVVASDITVGQNPAGITVNPATNMVYVANSGSNTSNTVSVIDGKTNQVVTNIPYITNPFTVALLIQPII